MALHEVNDENAECHQAQPAALHQKKQYPMPKQGEVGTGIDHHQARDGRSRHSGEHGLWPGNRHLRSAGQLQQQGAQETQTDIRENQGLRRRQPEDMRL